MTKLLLTKPSQKILPKQGQMAKSNENDDELSLFQKYGVPLFGAAWVPYSAAGKPVSLIMNRHVVLAGGGEEGRTGIPNAVLLSTFNFQSNSLSDQPVSTLGTGSDVPYRIAVHPGGEGLIFSSPKSCTWIEWDSVTSTNKHSLSLKSSEKVLEQLEDVGQQTAMTFNNEKKLLAVGGEDGRLRVFKWPAMEITLDKANAHTSVRDLDFSPDGKFLISLGSGYGCPSRIWDVSTSTVISYLAKENDEVFGFCRFSQTTDADLVLYVTKNRDNRGSIVKLNTNTWQRISSGHVHNSISSFNVSLDGKLLAVGTNEGDIFIMSSASMRWHTVVRKSHLGPVTSMAFSPDSRALISVSLDSSARVTLIKDKKKEEDGRLWRIILFFILLEVALCYAKKAKDYRSFEAAYP